MGKAGAKTYLAIPVVQRPLPLAALYHLERDPGLDRLVLVHESDPRRLLASSFFSYLEDPSYLERYLHTCSEVSESVRMTRVLVPPTASAADVAAALEVDMAGSR